MTGFVHSTVHTVIASQAMATAWVQVNTVAHSAVVKLLSGQGNGTLTSSNGQIALNLGPLIAVVKQDLVAHGFKLACNIPTVTPTLALFQAKDLGKAQALYRLVSDPQDRAAHPGACAARGRGVRGAGPPPGPDRGGAGGGRVHGGPRHRLADRPDHLPEQRPRPVCCPLTPPRPRSTRSSTSSRIGLRVVLAVGLVIAIGAFITGPSRAAVRTRAALGSGITWLRNLGERRGMSTGPVGQWTYRHRALLRIGALTLVALILVFWGQPTALTVILLVVILLILLGLIELVASPPAEPAAVGQE